jgi:hypothetical protein
MVWQVISFNLQGAGGRGSDEMVEYTIKWWAFIKENVPACKDVRLFRHVIGPNRWHYQVWLQFDGIEGWEGVAAVQGPLPWTVPDPRYPPIRSRVVQIDHQDEVFEEVSLD